MKRRTVFILILFNYFSFQYAQETQNTSFDVSGYCSIMPSLIWYADVSSLGKENPLWQLAGQNRLNFDWYPNEHITGSLQLRNQLIGGDFVELAEYSSGFKTENYCLPLTYQHTVGDQYFLSLSIDRLWVQYTYNKLEIKLGRQRINWGQTFAWNPNDLFNSYNFFDFDYPERPGADALRIQYYASTTSSIDIATKIDSAGNISGAGLFRFNHWDTDFQLLGGYLNHSNITLLQMDTISVIRKWDDHDLVAGLGFSGAIKSVSIRCEASYFKSLKENSDSTNLFLMSLGMDYTFANQTSVMAEIMYNSNVLIPEGSSFLSFYSGTQSIKTLTYTKYNFFIQAAYPVTPLLTASLGGMYFIDDKLTGFYMGPSADFSLGNDLVLSGIYQFFSFKTENTLTLKKEWTTIHFGFLRFKWNF
jgi:hypothetical protein